MFVQRGKHSQHPAAVGIALAVTSALIALASAPNAAAQEGLAASCEPDAMATTTVFSETTQHAQTFTSALTGNLTRAEVAIAKSPGSSGDWLVEIRAVDDATGSPTGSVLGSGVVDDAGVPEGFSLIGAVLANPPTVIAEEQYAVAVSRPGSPAFSWSSGIRPGNPCTGEKWISGDGGGTWEKFEAGDLPFRIFVTPPAPAATPIGPAPATQSAGPTGIRATALSHCKKQANKKDWSKKKLKKCKRRANTLPV